MKITGTYNNYLNMSNLLSSVGVTNSGNLVMQVFSTSIGNLQNKIDDQMFSAESGAALQKLYNEVSDLAAKATKLTLNDINSVFNDRTSTSSDTNILTASAFNAFSQDTGATEATYDISVAMLAQAQENIGSELVKTNASVVDLGTNTLNININGQDHEISIDVADGDSNDAVLGKIATAINEANIGMGADVIAGTVDGTQQLVINSKDTGTANAFSISDGSGNAVTATGAESVSTEAQDAAYTVDGADYSSGSNTIYLDDGMVTANLKGVGDAALTVAPDENEIKNSISTLVSEVNSLTDLLENNSEYIKDEVLSSVNSFIADHKSELESFGITIGDDRKLKVDVTKLAEAVSDNLSGIKEAFGGFDGLSVQANNYASRMASDAPLDYAKGVDGMNTNFLGQTYSFSAGMSHQLLQGMLLNKFV